MYIVHIYRSKIDYFNFKSNLNLMNYLKLQYVIIKYKEHRYVV